METTPFEIPPSIRPLLADTTRLLAEQTPGLVDAFYLHGSLALGAYNERLSDIDFLGLLARPAAEDDLRGLAEIHRIIRERYPRPEMQGAYLPWSHLGKTDEEAVAPYPHYDRSLRLSAPRGLDPVSWWLLKNHGIPWFGPDPRSLPFTIDWDALVRWMATNLHNYWGQWTRKPVRLMLLLSDWGVEWSVLGILRQFYTFREGSITSKRGAGEYALTCLPGGWRRLVREALRIRSGERGALYASRLARAVETVRFLRAVTGMCVAAQYGRGEWK